MLLLGSVLTFMLRMLCSYETMVIYSPDVQDSERDADIESFQSFLTDNGALDIQVSSDGIPSRMAYPIEGYNVGVYVLFMYAAPTR